MRVDLVALLTDSTDYYHSWILISNLTNRSDSSNGAVSIPTQEKNPYITQRVLRDRPALPIH